MKKIGWADAATCLVGGCALDRALVVDDIQYFHRYFGGPPKNTGTAITIIGVVAVRRL
jgi:hypothetical protein